MEAQGLLVVPANEPPGKFYGLTDAGRRWFAEFGIPVDAKCTARRCLDWTERRHHLAGPLGVRLMARLVALRWIERNRETRSVIVTASGAEGLRKRFGIAWEADGAVLAA
jgi:hypothetical protein